MNEYIIFENVDDKQKFAFEEEMVCETFEENKMFIDTQKLCERLGKKRALKNYRQRSLMKRNWRVNRHRMMRGIKKFHRSMKGKKIHRQIGRKLSLRNIKPSYRSSLQESLIAINSLKVHLLISNKYSSSIDDEVDYELFLDEALLYINGIENKIKDAIESYNKTELILDDDEIEFLNDVINYTEET